MVWIRGFHTTRSSLTKDKYKFYDLVSKLNQQIPSQKTRSGSQSLTFDTQPIKATSANKFNTIFGDPESLKEKRTTSRMSRENKNYSRKIGNVTVEQMPTEPDNCCGSGCANCVWVLFSDDLKEWKDQVSQAVKNLQSQDLEKTPLDKVEKWPADFLDPPKSLDSRLVDRSGVSHEREESPELPIGIQAFADLEAMIKKKSTQSREEERDFPLPESKSELKQQNLN